MRDRIACISGNFLAPSLRPCCVAGRRRERRPPGIRPDNTKEQKTSGRASNLNDTCARGRQSICVSQSAPDWVAHCSIERRAHEPSLLRNESALWPHLRGFRFGRDTGLFDLHPVASEVKARAVFFRYDLQRPRLFQLGVFPGGAFRNLDSGLIVNHQRSGEGDRISVAVNPFEVGWGELSAVLHQGCRIAFDNSSSFR